MSLRFYFLPLLAVAMWATPANADTIPVTTAKCIAPVEIVRPYLTDSTDMRGESYDVRRILDSNARVAEAKNDAFAHSITRGVAISRPATGNSMLHAFRFALNADRFTQLRLVVKHLRDYKVFVEGREQHGSELSLTPGRSYVTLLTMTDSASRDTFDVAVTGKSLEGITVGEQGKRPYDMSLMVGGDHYYDVTLSPTGKYLVTYYSYTQSDGKILYRTVLTEVATNREILRRSGYVHWQWWPRRDVLYLTRESGEGRELVTYDPVTGREEVVADHLPEGEFTLSPTGDYAIFTHDRQGREEKVQGLKRLEDPDDRQAGWRSRNALYRYDFKTHAMQPLTFGRESAWLNDISFDGKRLLVSFGKMMPSRMPFYRTTYVEIDAQTLSVDTIFADTIFTENAQYSPDGKQLLFKASPAAFGGIGSELKAGQMPNSYDYRLYIYDLATQRITPALRGFKPSVERAQWNYGDGKIYFDATDGSGSSLFRLDPATLKVTKFQLPLSYVSHYSIAEGMKEPRVAFCGQTGERARELYLATLNSAAPKAKRIGDIDFDKLFADVAIGTCHDWNFRTSRGDTVTGFYYLPADFDASRSYPMIVYYYGGCTPTAKVLEYHYPFSVFAAQGYVVYVCEPSGAIGFGQEFAARHVNTWGKESADDIIEGVQAFLREHPYVDAKHVGCMGASYGGFMTEYLQTRTNIFAAAISHAGISNIASYWGGGYWGYSYGETAQYGSFPWNNPDLYVKQSPLFNADKIHTPLLLLHGTADTNVPTTESQQLFTALRILGRPVSYVQIDGENHIIMDFNKRMAWQNVIFAWFAKWLKDQPLWWQTLYPNDDFGVK